MESSDTVTGTAGGPHQLANPPPPVPPPQPQLPPGFRFHPTDEELVVHYLKRKTQSAPLPVAIIAEVDLYKFDPWELPAKAVFGEQEWYFFSPRDRKYPNGARPNRAATSGYWKATGTDKPVLTVGNQKVGVKKALVFYGGKPPRGVKTNWIMHEYRLADNKPNNKPPGYDHCNKKGSLRLDDWVLCRIYKKNNAHRAMESDREDSMEEMMMMSNMPMSMSMPGSVYPSHHLTKSTLNYTSLLEASHEHHHHHHQGGGGGMFEGVLGGAHHSHPEIDPMIPPSLSPLGNPNALTLKRGLPSLYWGDQDPMGPSKRLSIIQEGENDGNNNNNNDNGDNNNNRSEGSTRNDNNNDDDDHNNSNNNICVAILLNQLPAQTPSSLHQQTMLGGLSDGVFRQQYPLSGLNWYS